MSDSRRNAWLLTLGAAAVFVASIIPMARRIADFNAQAANTSYHAESLTRTIEVEGFPKAVLTDVTQDNGESAIKLDYGGQTTLIPVKRPAAMNLPDLSAYDEWVKALAVYEVRRDEAGQQRHVTGSEHVVIAVRRTPEGYNPDTWGEVRTIDWLFDLYTLKRTGKVEKTTWRWPRSYRSEDRLQREARGEQGDARQIAAAKALVQYEPLKQRTFDYYVALFVMPKLNVPEYKFNDTAFNFKVLGWTLPATMGSLLAFTGALVFALAPRRPRQA